MAGGGRHKLFFPDKQHFAGIVADNVVAPAGQLELLRVVGKGESCHGGAHHASEVPVGDHVHPRHRRVGVGHHIVHAVIVEAAILVVEFEAAPDTELLFRFQDRVFHLVLVVLVGLFEALQLLPDGQPFAGVEFQPGNRVQQDALLAGDIIPVNHIHPSFVAVGRPQVFRVGHAEDEMLEPLPFALRGVVDDDEVEHQAVHLEIFESPEQLLGKARTLHAVDFQQQYGKISADAETPQPAL